MGDAEWGDGMPCQGVLRMLHCREWAAGDMASAEGAALAAAGAKGGC